MCKYFKLLYFCFRKLQLARFQWSVFIDDDQFEAEMDSLVERMKKAIAPVDPIENKKEAEEKSSKKQFINMRPIVFIKLCV